MKKNILSVLVIALSLVLTNQASAYSEILVRVSNIEGISSSPLGFMIKDVSLQKTCYVSNWLNQGDSVAVTMDQLDSKCKNESSFTIISSNSTSIGNAETIHKGQSCAMMYWPDKYIQCW